MTTTQTFNGTRILVQVDYSYDSDAVQNGATVGFSLDGATQTKILATGTTDYAGVSQSLSGAQVIANTPGTSHTIQLQWQQTTVTPATVSINSGSNPYEYIVMTVYDLP
jgi:hypothetical protein